MIEWCDKLVLDRRVLKKSFKEQNYEMEKEKKLTSFSSIFTASVIDPVRSLVNYSIMWLAT